MRSVDIPELHHLTDVIIFSTQGSRRAADLLAGGKDNCFCDILRLTDRNFFTTTQVITMETKELLLLNLASLKTSSKQI